MKRLSKKAASLVGETWIGLQFDVSSSNGNVRSTACGGGGTLTAPAFTLAEVLITLGIIGVVAALTMPSLIQHHREKQTVTSLKAAYSIFSQAFTMAVKDGVQPQDWGFSDIVASKDDEGNTHYENEENAASSKILFDTFVKHLQVAKICQPGDSSCLPTVNKGSFYSGILANGMSFNFIQRSGSCSSVSGTTPQLKNICADLTVDIDGPAKGRNAWGKDWFRFHVTKYGLIPKGTKEDTKWSFEKVCYTTNTATYNGDYGQSSTAWVMYNEKTDNLRFKD